MADAATRDELLQLILGQLQHWGFTSIVPIVAQVTGTSKAVKASNQLSELVSVALDVQRGKLIAEPAPEAEAGAEFRLLRDPTLQPGKYIDFETEGGRLARPPAPRVEPQFSLWHHVANRAGVRAVKFSNDGRYVAMGTVDSAIKVLDVTKMHKAVEAEGALMRAFFDHNSPINDLEFSPDGTLLASASEDRTLKLFEMRKSGNKKALRQLQDWHPVNSLCFHPTGDYIYAATDHEAIRIVDVKTFQVYSSSTANQHFGPILSVQCAPLGNYYATASEDGHIRVWDVVSGRAVRDFDGAHDGASVECIRFTKNGRYLVSQGRDATIRMWDLSQGRVVMNYDGFKHPRGASSIALTFDEEMLLATDQSTDSVICYDTLTGKVLRKMNAHTNTINTIAASPIELGFVTGSDDFKLKYWHSDD